MSDHLDLSAGDRRGRLQRALEKAFRQPNSLDMFLTYRLRDEPTPDLPGPVNPLAWRVSGLVGWHEERGIERRLLVAALAARPGNPELAALARDVLGIHTVDHTGASIDEARLERLVRRSEQDKDVGAWSARLLGRMAQVCRLALPIGTDTVLGTGFLIGPDRILTNHHVVAQVLAGKVRPADVAIEFDYVTRAGARDAVSRRVNLAKADWLIATRPPSKADASVDGRPAANELDYAVLRLEEELGDQPIGTSDEPSPVARGWISLPAAPPSSAIGRDLFILQHPNGEMMRLSVGRVAETPPGIARLRYDATTWPGSSGSPVFDSDFNVVALHHAGDPRTENHAAYNQGIPIHLVRQDVDQQEAGRSTTAAAVRQQAEAPTDEVGQTSDSDFKDRPKPKPKSSRGAKRKPAPKKRAVANTPKKK